MEDFNFKVGDYVKCRDYEGSWCYYVVLEDNRYKFGCTYTFTLVEPDKYSMYSRGLSSGKFTVYCKYPQDIYPVSAAEKILYF